MLHKQGDDRIFGLFDLYSFSSICQLEVSKMPLLGEQRVLQWKNLNWPRCLCRVTEGLTLKEGEFLLKAMLFFHSKIVSLWCVFWLWRSRAIMCNVCGPGNPPQPARFFLLWSWQMCHTFWGRNIALLSNPLEEVRYIPHWAVKQFLKDGHALVLGFLFLLIHYLKKCMLEGSSINCEVCDMYIGVGSMCG